MKQNENYEKKYKEALERASHIKDYNTIGTPQEIAELIFPELKQELEQKECIWDIPEDERHCEFCSAYCNKFPTISTTTTQTLEQAALDYAFTCVNGIQFFDSQEKLIARSAFKAGAEWQKKQFSDILDKWMEHATRGSEKGNHIYHLGKIALILDIQEWLKEDKETPSNSVKV